MQMGARFFVQPAIVRVKHVDTFCILASYEFFVVLTNDNKVRLYRN